MRIASMRVRVEGPDDASDEANQAAYNSIDWDEIEETISVMLPEGYYAKVED